MEKEIVKLNEYIENEFYSQPMEWIDEEITKLLKSNISRLDYNENEENIIDDVMIKAKNKTTKKIMEMLENVYNSINNLMLGSGNVQAIRQKLGKLSILLIIVLNQSNSDFLEDLTIDETIKCENYETLKKILDNFFISRELKTNILLSSKK
ncbi:hypothetical protein [uncultured Sneathia sp.]|uniref:hypothetical protein n=1 Tax=uncultured Sneathia sp. TaxID=278067 RepID=UPI00259371F7|nr:hypothetical protein [uncultured Sneathia sp.]